MRRKMTLGSSCSYACSRQAIASAAFPRAHTGMRPRCLWRPRRRRSPRSGRRASSVPRRSLRRCSGAGTRRVPAYSRSALLLRLNSNLTIAALRRRYGARQRAWPDARAVVALTRGPPVFLRIDPRRPGSTRQLHSLMPRILRLTSRQSGDDAGTAGVRRQTAAEEQIHCLTLAIPPPDACRVPAPRA